MRLLAVALCLIVPTLGRADDLATKIAVMMDAPIYKPARWGALVVDAQTGATVYERDADRLFLPASVTKLYTCATALAELGPDHRFTTPVYRRGEVKDGVLAGDLILVASGDLTFGGRQGKEGKTLFADNDHTYANSGLMNSAIVDANPVGALDDLAKQVFASGIKEIRGEVLIDDRLFPRARSSGSGPDGVGPILVNDNVVDIIVTPGAAAGDPATVLLRPETAFVQADADVRTVKDGTAAVTVEATGPCHFLVRGTVPLKAAPVVRIFSVDDPALYARALLIEALRRVGVRVAASLHKPRRQDLPARDAYTHLPVAAEYQSELLADTIKVTLKVSHNLYASTLPILVGLKHGTGTIDAGLRQQAKFFKGIGVEPGTLSFAGGAGGAPADAATPRATVSLLRAMAKHPAADAYFGALPILGVDGTLAESVAKDSPARGKVRAKTGTLVWYDAMNDRSLLRSKALAGELETAKGTKLYFALFLNDLPLKEGGTAGQQGKMLGKICETIYANGP